MMVAVFDRLQHLTEESEGDRGEGGSVTLTETGGLGFIPAVPEQKETYTAFLGTIRDELLEVLYRRDVAPIHHASMTFDSSVQQAIGTEPAASAEDNNLVARVIRRGFRHGERVLRPEEVIVKRYRQEVKA